MPAVTVIARVRPALESLENAIWMNTEGNSVEASNATGKYVSTSMDCALDDSSSQGETTQTCMAHWQSGSNCSDLYIHIEEVYERVKSSIRASLDGINVTVMCYGSTGTGKTYTMGLQSAPTLAEEGIIPRAIKDIFHQAALNQPKSIKISFSFIEIYQERIYDLLLPVGGKKNSKLLEIREDASGRVIPGLTCITVSSPTDLNSLMTKGNKSRKTRETEKNSHSSRSHAILQVFIERQQSNGTARSTLAFVDLAGSEKWSKEAHMEDSRVNELCNINSSLGALASVVSALSDGTRKPRHIPYRDSKLTYLLQDSLGGNSLLSLIVTLSPSVDCFTESVRTLRFADRASSMLNNPVVNLSYDVGSLLDHKEREIKRLRGILSNLISLSCVDKDLAAVAATDEMRSVSSHEDGLLKELEEARRALAEERLLRQDLERKLNRNQRPQSESTYERKEAVGSHSYHLTGLTPPATSGSWRPNGNAYDSLSPISRGSTASNLTGKGRYGSHSPMVRHQAERRNGSSKVSKIEEAIAAIRLRISDLSLSSPKKSTPTNHNSIVSPHAEANSSSGTSHPPPSSSSGWGRSAFISSSHQAEGVTSRPTSSSSSHAYSERQPDLTHGHFGRSTLALTPTKPRDSRVSSARERLGAATMIYILGTTQSSHRSAKIGANLKVDAEKLAKNGSLFESLAKVV